MIRHLLRAIIFVNYYLLTTTYQLLLINPRHEAGGFPMPRGCVWCIERKAPAFSDQTIHHTSPIMLNDKSNIYIDHIEIFHACGAKNFVP